MKELGIRIAWSLIFVTAGVISAQAQNRVASRFGEAQVGNQRVIVHVTVAVPPGLDGNNVAEDALRGQGARPFQAADFQTSGLVWDQFINGTIGPQVLQNYNSAGAPLNAAASLASSQATWTGVTTSKFLFTSGTTSRCPSLVKECPGPQVFDGFNDVGWAAISGCCTLGVTWYSTSIDEADMALNSRFQWSTSGGTYDVETVFLHENGHVLGLGHSPAPLAVMQANYGGMRRTLTDDDARGVTYLYPDALGTGSISGTVSGPSGPIANASISVANLPVTDTTDASGAYTLSGVPAIGSYSVTASAQGFTSETSTSGSVTGGNTTTLDFNLAADSGGGGGGGGGGCIPRGNGNNCK